MKRSRYLAEIVEEVERYDRWADEQGAAAEKLYRLHGAGEAEGAENASLQVTALAAGTVTGRVISPTPPVPAADRSSRAAVGEWRQGPPLRGCRDMGWPLAVQAWARRAVLMAGSNVCHQRMARPVPFAHIRIVSRSHRRGRPGPRSITGRGISGYRF